MRATAPNDSQTPPQAPPRDEQQYDRQRQGERARGDAMRAATAQAHHRTIQNVRCAGTAKPAISVAERAAIAASAPAWRGRRSVSQGERRHSQLASQAQSPETRSVQPEMLIRCVTPVRLNRRHSSADMARWSPTASAARMPLAGVSPSTRLKRSRTDSRIFSMRSMKLFLAPRSRGEA